MSHSSPASYLIWTVLVAMLGAFLIFHLWSFDRFKCLKWNSGASSGAFKRVMTYSYLITVPMIFTYAVGNMIIKYHEGFYAHPTLGIIPKPYQLWEPIAQSTIFPLMLLFSIGWGLEMVTHLEELCFWLFLVNSGSGQQNWFHSLYFKTWVGGSAIAIIYMPLVTIFTRGDHLKSEAYTFLAGSLGSLSLTLWFLPILWTFPSFLNNLRVEGVDVATIVRLTKFAELNTIRIVFRFIFTIPFLILGVDGVRPHNHVNESMLWTDFLTTVAGFGCVISSAITLVIFFPRSIEGEIAARDAEKERKLTKSFGRSASNLDIESTHRQVSGYHNHEPSPSNGTGNTYLLTSSPIKKAYSLDEHNDDIASYQYHPDITLTQNVWDHDEERDVAAALPPIKPLRRKMISPRESDSGSSLTESNLSMHNTRIPNINPMIANFRSPIDIHNGETMSRLTFSRK